MAKADVLQLVADLSAGLADQTASGRFYDDIVFEMGLGRSISMTGAAFIKATKSTGQVSFPPTSIRPLLMFYDDTCMHPSDIKEAEAYDKQWRTTLGDPRVWLVEQETNRTISVVPVPRRSGATVGLSTPFSAAFPEGNFLAVYTENRADVHAFEELTTALQVMIREFARESDHTDHTVVQFCTALSEMLNMMLATKR